MAGCSLSAAGCRSSFYEHERLARRGSSETVHQAATIRDPFDVRQTDRCGVVVGIPLEIVGNGYGGSIARRHRPADSNPGRARQVQEARHEIATLAGDTDGSHWWIRSNYLSAKVHRRADNTLTIGPGEEDPQFIGERHEFILGESPGISRLAVPG